MTTPARLDTTSPPDAAGDPDEDFEIGIGPEIDLADCSWDATLADLERFTAERDGAEVTLIRWMFAVDTADGPVEVTGVSSTARGPRAKAVAWLSALVGADAEPGASFRRKELIGRACLVVIEHDDNKFPKIANVVAAPRKK